MRSLVAILVCASLGSAGCGSGADDGPGAVDRRRDGPPVLASVAAHALDPGRVRLTWRFDLAEGWHLYWPGLNDSGFPPRIALELPDGWRAGELRWPVPERKVLPGDILDHVYDRPRVELQQVVTRAPGARGALRAELRWLACREACVPGDTTLALDIGADLPAAADAPPADVYPRPLPPERVTVRRVGATLQVDAPGAAHIRFFPAADSGTPVDLLREGETAGSRLSVRLRTDGPDTAGPVRGLVQIEYPDGETLTGPVALAAATGGRP